MLLARPVTLSSLADAQAVARRVGLAEGSAATSVGGKIRGLSVLVTGLDPASTAALRAASRPPEAEGPGPVVLTGGGEAALLSGSRWELFSLATALADSAPALAGRLAACLRRTDAPPAPLTIGPGRLDFGARTFVMGIVNVTPDSFSDGGRFSGPDGAMAHARALVEAGADLLDIGGESTRPGAAPVPADEERARVVPVIRGLVGCGVPLSVDTTKAEVARAALDAGAHLVNDVSALARDPQLAEVVAEAKVPAILMHMRGTPADMGERTDYRDLVGEVLEELALAVGRAREVGIAEERILVDPGLGFAKTAAQSLTLLSRLDAFAALGRPVVVGASRKSFIGAATGAPVHERVSGSVAAAVLAAERGAHVVRVHDVAETVQALAFAGAVRSARGDGEAFAEGSGWWRPDDPRVAR